MASDGQPDRPRAGALRRLPRIAVGAIAGLWLLYLAGANGFLRSEWGQETLNRNPEKLTITWQSAWTWWPGIVQVRELAIHGQARRAEWRVAADSGRMVIFLPSLLRRHFHLLGADASGTEVETRVLPPPESTRRLGRKRPWRVTLEDLEIDPLRILRVNDYELRGKGRAAGWAHFEVRGPVELGLSSLSFVETVLLDGGEVAAEALRFDGQLQIEPFVVGDDTVQDLMAGLTGAVELETEASSLGFLAAYLGRLPWLSLGGSGHLTADIEAANGWLAPGSRLSLEGPMVAADLFGLHATGEGRLVGIVPEGSSHTELTVRLPLFSVLRQLDEALLLEGEDLEVVVINDSTAIDRPAEGITLAIQLPPTRVPDLAAFSLYLPEAMELEITGGSAQLEANLGYSAAERSGEGWLKLRGQQVEATFHDVDLRANVLLDSRLGDARLEDGHIDLSGTRLEIDGVRTRDKGRLRDSGWWGRLHLLGGLLVKDLADLEAEPAILEAEVSAELRDTGPLVAMLEQHVPRLAWMDGLLTVHDVEARSDVRIQGPRISLGDLAITGGKKGRLEILGELDLARQDPSGVLFARWGKLSAAVSLAEGERNWRLTGSRKWYDANVLSHRGARPMAGAKP